MLPGRHVLLAYVLTWRYATMLSSGQKPSSDSTIAHELNDSLHELYKPLGTPSMCVIFLHGLQSGDSRDAHLSTWKSGDGSCVWPQIWLAEKFPGAHVLSVSYSAHVKKNEQGEFDIYNTGENLLSDILHVKIGQVPYCPVILVGHCFGGFVIKELCNRAYDSFTRASDLQKKVKLGMLLGNIRGIFFYGTPHHGSPLMNTKVHHLASNLLEYFKLLSKDGARLNERFEQLRRLYSKWRVHGLGESRSTKSGVFHGIVGAPEASSRAGDSFNIVDADHIQICRPEKKTRMSFSGLVGLLESIATDVKEEQAPAQEEEAQARAQEEEAQARAQEEEPQAAERSRLRLPKQIIGIEALVEVVKTKLVASRTLGLVGMGGCGKTTLVNAVFNNLVRGFEYSAYVGEVKKISGRKDDLKKEVWSQMHRFGKEMDGNPKWSLLNQKSLLLVLDDVSTDRDLEVLLDIAEDLSPESRFLVTSRDRDLLKRLDMVFKVPFLEKEIAKELFMRHAFPEKNAAPSQLASLVDAIVDKCDGLPLTLEVIGKYLFKIDDKQDWEQTLSSLCSADSVADLNEKLWKKLKLSFDGLEEKEQQIFLDVATFFCGNRCCSLGEAKAAWKAAYGLANERLLWRTLVDRSLVYDVQDTEIIQMHEQLLDLGRKIGANHNNTRRVWDEKEARDLLQTTTQRHNEEIIALRLHENRSPEVPLRIARRTLLSLTGMRYLEVNANATISGGPEDEVQSFLANLVFIRLQSDQQQFTADVLDCTILTRLVILHLDGYNEDYLPESFSSMSALKTLNLDCCRELHTLPESFGDLSALSTLQFNDCVKLQSLPESFGDLSALSTLEFCWCSKLQSLPESFGNLSTLSTLRFSECNELESLPESFGNLSALSTLCFSCDKWESLPESFGNLSALSTLEICGCSKLQSLPESFGNLSALSTLEFHGSKLQSLPESFGNLFALSTLVFEECFELQSLPESFGNLYALSTLDFYECSHELYSKWCSKLQSLPESFGNLSALSTLEFQDYSELQSLPESFGNLSALSTLKFYRCSMLQSLPESFGNLSALSTLEFSECDELQSLPESFGNLSALSTLEFSECDELESLPESFGNLSALSTLKFYRCSMLQSLPESFGNLFALSTLECDSCFKLQSLPESFGNLSALSTLKFYRCSMLQSLPESFGNLFALSTLECDSCFKLKSLPESFGNLFALSTLVCDSCFKLKSLPESFGNLSALSTLKFYRCSMLQSLPESFGNLSALSTLDFRKCDELQSLSKSFGNLSALVDLQFRECNELGRLPESFGLLPALSKLQFCGCGKLQTLPESFGQVFALRYLSIKRVALRSVPDSIRSLPLLQVLELGCLPFVKEFPPWLGKAEAGLRKMSKKTFDVRDGHFALNAQRILEGDGYTKVIRELCERVLKMVESSNFAVHCDKCGMYPLEWPRYKFSPSWTQFCDALCPNCFQQSGSNALVYTCEDSPGHNMTCDDCQMYPLKGPRYKSSTRSDFNLCQDCFRRSGSNASEYICSDPSVLSAGDGTTVILDTILDLDADDRNSEIHWSSERVQVRVFILRERGILKRLVGDLRGALEDLNKALQIGLSQTFSEFIRKVLGYSCLKHRAYVKFLLGDLDGARRDAQEALAIENVGSEWKEFATLRCSLGARSVKFLGIEML